MTAQEKKLPAPSFAGGMPVNEAVAARRSCRDFDPSRPVDDATLGQLLWMSAGVNRPDARPDETHPVAANRANPTAMNWQEIRVFVFSTDGVSEYDPAGHSLKRVAIGDHRALVAGTSDFKQDFVLDAPCSILFVADLKGKPEGEQARSMALVDAGIACQGLNLACASLGIATVPRATMDSAAIAALLNLDSRCIPVINNPIGYPRH